jgi:hypothetical protein
MLNLYCFAIVTIRDSDGTDGLQAAGHFAYAPNKAKTIVTF